MCNSTPQCVRTQWLYEDRSPLGLAAVPRSLDELAWQRRQDREAAHIQRQEAREQAAVDEITAIASEYSFTVNDGLTYLSAAGDPLQMAMDLVSKDGREAVTIVFDATTGEWSAILPVPASHSLQAFIGAVKARVEKNRAARLAQAT